MMKKAYLFLVIICLSSLTVFSGSSSTTSPSEQKYLILKLDDINNFPFWNEILALFMPNSNYIGNFGITGMDLVKSSYLYDFVKEILQTPRNEIFNHGWDHLCPEFANQTLDYQVKHIENWDSLFSNLFNFKTQVLGAPCNKFDLTTFTAMNNTNYNTLYFSKEAGFKLKNVYADGFSLEEIQTQEKLLDNEQTILYQVHFGNANYWNSIDKISAFLNHIFTSGRIGLTMTDYYYNFFLPTHPNYFLFNATNFAKSNITDATIYSMPIPESNSYFIDSPHNNYNIDTEEPYIARTTPPQTNTTTSQTKTILSTFSDTNNHSFTFKTSQNNINIFLSLFLVANFLLVSKKRRS